MGVLNDSVEKLLAVYGGMSSGLGAGNCIKIGRFTKPVGDSVCLASTIFEKYSVF